LPYAPDANRDVRLISATAIRAARRSTERQVFCGTMDIGAQGPSSLLTPAPLGARPVSCAALPLTPQGDWSPRLTTPRLHADAALPHHHVVGHPAAALRAAE